MKQAANPRSFLWWNWHLLHNEIKYILSAFSDLHSIWCLTATLPVSLSHVKRLPDNGVDCALKHTIKIWPPPPKKKIRWCCSYKKLCQTIWCCSAYYSKFQHIQMIVMWVRHNSSPSTKNLIFCSVAYAKYRLHSPNK